MKKTLAAAGVFVSMMVGAGFASGRELYTFFMRYGVPGYGGIIISCLILALCGWAVMDIANRLGLRGYGDFMRTVLGRPLGSVTVFIVNIFIGVMLSVMFSGFGEALQTATGLGFTYCVMIIAALSFLTFLFDLKGIIGVSAVLAPILAVGGVFFGLYTTLTSYVPTFLSLDSMGRGLLLSALLYASYNLLTGVSVLSVLGGTLPDRKSARRAALISGAVIAVMGLAFAIPMNIHMESLGLADLSMPMMTLAASYGPQIEFIYMVVLFAAIFTTAVSNGFAFIEWLSGRLFVKKLGLPKTVVKLITTVGGAILAHIGFKTFVDKAYPFFGYVGLFEIAVIILYFFFGKKTGAKDE